MNKAKPILIALTEALSLINLTVVIPAYLFLATITYHHPLFVSIAPTLGTLALFVASYAVILFLYRRLLRHCDTPVKRWLFAKKAPA